MILHYDAIPKHHPTTCELFAFAPVAIARKMQTIQPCSIITTRRNAVCNDDRVEKQSRSVPVPKRRTGACEKRRLSRNGPYTRHEEGADDDRDVGFDPFRAVQGSVAVFVEEILGEKLDETCKK